MRYWLAVLAATLAACGGDGSSSPPAQSVEDTTPPVITLIGDNPQIIEAGEDYTELGATATDNIDGDLSASIVIDATSVDSRIPGDYTVNYAVRDAAGNTGTAARTVTVQDTTPPVITLLGDNPQVVITGSTYTELGANASDSLDGDLTDSIVIDASALNTTVVGEYIVIYDVTDGTGNPAVTVTRTVSVQHPPGPDVTVSGDIKTLIFSWAESRGVEFYRLLENADGHSGFSQVGDDIPAGTLTAKLDIAVHLFDWVEAQYLIEACNAFGCNMSDVVTVDDVMLSTIGTVESPFPDDVDGFGEWFTLSADGQTLAVSASLEDSSSPGVNGDEADNLLSGSGAVYVYRRNGNRWKRDAYIKASNPDAEDRFGRGVALSRDGNTLVVGAVGEDSGSAGIDGDQQDNGVPSAGAIYVFRHKNDAWVQEAYIKAPDTGEFDYLGGSLELSDDGDTLAAYFSDDSSVGGIDGDPTDNSIEDSGAVLVFRFDGAAWYQQAYIKAISPEAYDSFGSTVDLDGDGNTLAVGVYGEDSIATGIDGDFGDNSALESGAVYVFELTGESWEQQAYIKATNTDPYDRFGQSLALSRDGNTLAVGAHFEDSGSIGIDGDQSDNSVASSGAVYIYKRTGDTWQEDSYVKSSNPDPTDVFGIGVALNDDGNILAVSAWGERSAAVGIGGDQTDNSAPLNTGAVYVFSNSDLGWQQVSYVKSPNPPTIHPSGLGYRVRLSGDGRTLGVSTSDSEEAVFWY
jgi:hypothetical protein